MFFRLLFLLLLALNAGVAAWLAFGAARVAPVPARTDAGVPELRLLSERPGPPEAQSAELDAAPESRAALAADKCMSLGPFPTQADVRVAIDALTPHVPRIQYREAQATQSRGWWVFLPAFATREQALQTARALSAKGVRDYYVVTAGDQQNTISLGLFHDPGNAERRRTQVTELGFQPQMRERVEAMPVYFVDFALPDTPQFDWRTWLPQRADMQAQPVACF